LSQAALQLSEEQVAHMVRARREFLASLKAVLQQRRALSDIITACIAQDCHTNPAISAQHNKVHAVVCGQKCVWQMIERQAGIPFVLQCSLKQKQAGVMAPPLTELACAVRCSAWRWCTCWSAM
jgi:hypothetical protein